MATQHYLDFLCEGYTGNFEIEFVSYVFNSLDYEQEHRDARGLLTEAERTETNRVLGEGFLDFFYGEYGHTNVEIDSAVNPADGREYDTVRVHVSDRTWQNSVNEEVVAFLKARAQAFFPAYIRDGGDDDAAFVALVHTAEVSETRVEVL